jgi:hypothetical protein
MAETKNVYRNFMEEDLEKDGHLEDLEGDERITLNWDSRKLV